MDSGFVSAGAVSRLRKISSCLGLSTTSNEKREEINRAKQADRCWVSLSKFRLLLCKGFVHFSLCWKVFGIVRVGIHEIFIVISKAIPVGIISVSYTHLTLPTNREV